MFPSELHNEQPRQGADLHPRMPVKDCSNAAIEIAMAKEIIDQSEEAKGPRLTMLWIPQRKPWHLLMYLSDLWPMIPGGAIWFTRAFSRFTRLEMLIQRIREALNMVGGRFTKCKPNKPS